MKRGKEIEVGDAFYTVRKGERMASKFGVVTRIEEGISKTFNNEYELSDFYTFYVKTDFDKYVKEIKMLPNAYILDYYVTNKRNTLFVPSNNAERTAINDLLRMQFNYSQSIVREEIRTALGLD